MQWMNEQPVRVNRLLKTLTKHHSPSAETSTISEITIPQSTTQIRLISTVFHQLTDRGDPSKYCWNPIISS